MKHNKSRLGSRRQTRHMPIVPFKDSSGTTIWGCVTEVDLTETGKRIFGRDKLVSFLFFIFHFIFVFMGLP